MGTDVHQFKSFKGLHHNCDKFCVLKKLAEALI